MFSPAQPAEASESRAFAQHRKVPRAFVLRVPRLGFWECPHAAAAGPGSNSREAQARRRNLEEESVEEFSKNFVSRFISGVVPFGTGRATDE